MLILGTKAVQHDACFALIRDGEPLFIYEQERFNRVKHGMSSGLAVLFEALAEHGVSPADIDLVTNCIDPSLLEPLKGQVRGYLEGPALRATEEYLDWRLPTWRRALLAAGFAPERVVDIRHHVCHAAGVYYASPFDDAAVFSVDGSGETETALMAHGRDGRLEIVRTTPRPQSLGLFYQAATFWLGWGFGEEGKTMALAAYGDPARHRAELDSFLRFDETGEYRYTTLGERGDFGYTPREMAAGVFGRFFGPPRREGEALTQLHKDVAAAVQAICEEILLASARHLKAVTGSRNLLLTGGVALNSVGNGLIVREKLFDRVITYPQASDTGTALGGALYAYHAHAASPRRRWTMPHAYWGRRVDVENVEAAARRTGARGAPSPDVADAAAGLLAAGKIVGWVRGRAEVGPRALGNRSVLASPLVPGIKEKINEGVKHRENWRPFAPSVLREELEVYFEADQDLPYMTIVAPVRPEWRDRLASVSHVDGTARVQTVTEESNPAFYALLKAFKRRTGLGVLLNTSFNDRGEPLVQTCEQALRLFRRSAMDALCIEDWVFTGKDESVEVPPFAPWLDNARKLPRGRLLLAGGLVPGAAAMLAHFVEANPGLRVAAPGDGSVLDAFPAIVRSRVAAVDVAEVGALRGEYDGVVFYVSDTGDKFIFDRELYFSETAELSRRIMEEAALPVFWIDARGDVTPARDVLYVHHARVGSPLPSSYERFWNGSARPAAVPALAG